MFEIISSKFRSLSDNLVSLINDALLGVETKILVDVLYAVFVADFDCANNRAHFL